MYFFAIIYLEGKLDGIIRIIHVVQIQSFLSDNNADLTEQNRGYKYKRLLLIFFPFHRKLYIMDYINGYDFLKYKLM